MNGYDSGTFLELFDKPWENTPEERLELRRGKVRGYRVKTIRSGSMLECEIYPIWCARPTRVRGEQSRESSQAQKNLNHRNLRKHVARLANVNFTAADLWGTFGYDDENVPQAPEEARRDVRNFLRRLRRRYQRAGLPELRYLYVTEWYGADGKRVRCHHHILLSGGLSRDEIESCWHGGAYPQTRRLRVKRDCGLSGLAQYITKSPDVASRWGRSQNLRPPTVTVADRKISRAQVERIAGNEPETRLLLERKYTGYRFHAADVRRSSLAAGVYIYAAFWRAFPGTEQMNKRKRRSGEFSPLRLS